MRTMAQIASLLTFLLLLLHASVVSSGSRFGNVMLHIHPKGHFTKLELHQRAVQQSMQRTSATIAALKEPSSSNSTIRFQSPYLFDGLIYKMKLAIGTPPVPFMAGVDILGDITWTQCQSCTQCHDYYVPIYDPSKSSTFSKVACDSYLCRTYSNGACTIDCTFTRYTRVGGIQGVIATETLTFRAVDERQASVSGVGFACFNSNRSSRYNGVLGLRRDRHGSVTGLDAFSYCLAPFEDSKFSSFFFGSLPEFNDALSIPLLSSPLPLYFLPLEGITVGKKRLPIPKKVFEVDDDGFGGLLVDINSPYSLLKPVAFQLVKKELTSSLKLPIVDPSLANHGLCYLSPSSSSVKVPELVFHFQGADLKVSNYMIRDRRTGFLCSTILKGEISVLGSFQQQNMHVVYDLVGQKVSIRSAQCARI